MDIFKDVEVKARAGFNVSLSHFFARISGYEFIPGARGGAETTYSSVLDLPSFQKHSMPMPMGLAKSPRPTQSSLV